MNRRTFLHATAALTSLRTLAADKKAPRIVLRSSWQTVNIGDIGVSDWLFDLDQPDELARVAATALAMVKDPTDAQAKAAKAREFVQQRQRDTMAILRQNLGLPA